MESLLIAQIILSFAKPLIVLYSVFLAQALLKQEIVFSF